MNDVSNENPEIVNLMLEKLADYHVSFWLTTLKVQKQLGPAQSIYGGNFRYFQGNTQIVKKAFFEKL